MKVKSQKEVKDKYVTLLTTEDNRYRKSTSAFARKGIKGETITTVIDGKKETEKTIQDDDSYVITGPAAFETYTITGKEFNGNYDVDNPVEIEIDLPPYQNLRKRGYKQYVSKRMVVAHEVNEDDMEWFKSGTGTEIVNDDKVYFVAPWDEEMLIEKGDILVMTYPSNGKDGIYRIERAAFNATYQPLEAKDKKRKVEKM